MIRSLFVILIGAFLITGCSNTNSDRSALPSAVESGVGSVDAYWDEVAKQGLMMSPFVDPEPPMEYVRIGLNHDNPDVRWFCAYELLKYPSGIDQETRNTLERLTKDESEVVRKAASFTMAVLQEKFEDERFQLSPANNQAAFHLYRESRYNDGGLWIAEDGRLERLAKLDGSIAQIAYSPDGNRIGADYGGRTWGSLAIVDLESRKVELPEIISAILADKRNGYDVDPQKADRFDPYVRLIEWSPDSTRYLVSYEFSGGPDQYDYGWAVCEAEGNTVVEVYKSSQDTRDSKPEGFTWSNG
ncbi:HEAT repeat domain-containing protein [Cohnella herbarum]|uniref:HEAT repeat domain-containing protein n=1 Tax=Cohnella herbarum TaxID=2728023 RepID=A0A7Z2VLJ7_9BACL|nr:HEAT repeat domain-containing protein [Cohnella herbarum]QJD85154.1 HEAT repeat domain-containing protein [Cohnella herbarum]